MINVVSAKGGGYEEDDEGVVPDVMQQVEGKPQNVGGNWWKVRRLMIQLLRLLVCWRWFCWEGKKGISKRRGSDP